MKNKNWNPDLSPEQNYILKHEGTEPAGSSELNYEKEREDITAQDVELHYFHLILNMIVDLAGHLFINHCLMYSKQKLTKKQVILAQNIIAKNVVVTTDIFLMTDQNQQVKDFVIMDWLWFLSPKNKINY